MLQVEILPQSMVDIKTIFLKPRLDQGEIGSMGETMKSRLFSKFGFKPKPEDIKLLASEEFFEPYFIIGGKYVLDYCKKHVLKAEVDKNATKLCVAGQEFHPKQPDQKTTQRVLEITCEEHARYEKQAYYILDRLNREIPPERLPISPFNIQQKKSELNSHFRKINISDEKQIDFLKTKIAQRPADLAEIIKEAFDITDRTIAYYPMYQLTFENAKKRKEVTVTIDGITGEVIPNGTRNLDGKTIAISQEDQVIITQLSEPAIREEIQTEPQIEPTPDFVPSVTKHEVKVSPKEDQITEPQLSQSAVCKESQTEPIRNVAPRAVNDDSKVTPKEDQVIEFKRGESVVFEEVQPEPVLQAVPSIAGNDRENASKDDRAIQQTKPEEAPLIDQEQKEPNPKILPPYTAHSTQNAPKEETSQPPQPGVGVPMILGFPTRILDEFVATDDNVATVEGDVEIPSGTNINKDLVVKGALRIGNNCRGHGKLKAFKDITIGADTIIDGDIISGGNIFVGPRSLINGSVEAVGTFEIEENAVIETICPRTPSSQ